MQRKAAGRGLFRLNAWGLIPWLACLFLLGALSTPDAFATTVPTRLDAGHRFSCAIHNGGEVWCWGENRRGNLGDGTTTNRATARPVKSHDGMGLLSDVTVIATGDHHACALAANGGVWCWGSNGAGQLGDGTWDDRSLPVQVKGIGGNGLLSGMTSIAAGAQHTCASNNSSLVVCWGSNDSGQLGNSSVSSSNSSLVPVQTKLDSGQPLLDVAGLAAGQSQSCAVKHDGTVWCWGTNRDGELGNGQGGPNAIWNPSPVQVMTGGESIQALTGMTAITSGARHNCARGSDGSVWCWGANWAGQSGTGQASQNWRALRVQGVSGQGSLSGALGVDAGAWHTCAYGAQGALWCWGENSSGQLGSSLGVPREWPTPVLSANGQDPLTGVTTVAGGTSHTCAETSNDTVLCWGQSTEGQLGTGTLISSFLPSRVGTVDGGDIWTGASAVSAGGFHSCAVDADQTAWCWGLNSSGQLGNGSSDPFSWSAAPQHVSDASGNGVLSDVVAVGTGYEYSCALTDAGAVWCWGNNYVGQLGDGTFDIRSRPVQVRELPEIQALAVGAHHACAISVDGALWCWGGNGSGQLGDGTVIIRALAVPVQGLANVTAVAAGFDHSCAIAAGGGVSGGAVWCWGDNGEGQLGNGTTTTNPVPSVVHDSAGQSLLGDMRDVTAGYSHTCAQANDGHVWCWGSNHEGQLGDGTSVAHALPALVHVGPDTQSDLLTASKVVAGASHTCALTPQGGVYCWGGNGNGQLGNGNDEPKLWPTATRAGTGITNLTDVSALSTSNTHNCGIVGQGNESQIWCWGYNDYAQIGRTPGTTRPQAVIWGASTGQPRIAIAPGSVMVSLLQGQKAHRNVAIANEGTLELVWATLVGGNFDLLHDNGPLVTHVGQGFNGADVSAIASSLGNTTLGFGDLTGRTSRVADDFLVTASGWRIEYATFWVFQYQTPPSSVLDLVTLRIWDGVPGAPGSSVVFGDTATNRFLHSQFSGIYRASDETLLWSTMPIMSVMADVGVDLPEGRYWLDWEIGSSTSASLYHMFVTLPGTLGKPGSNAVRLGSNWTPVSDAGSGVAQDIPFDLWGADPDTTQCTALIDVPWLSVEPLSGTVAPGASTEFIVNVDSAQLAAGIYKANVCIANTDIDRPIVVLPVELKVEPVAVGLTFTPAQPRRIDPITFTATVDNGQSGGRIRFLFAQGTGDFGPAACGDDGFVDVTSSGSATCVVTLAVAGDYVWRAEYYEGDTSLAVSADIPVAVLPISVELTFTPAQPRRNDPITLTATVDHPQSGGRIRFLFAQGTGDFGPAACGDDGFVDVTSSGSATCVATLAVAGDYVWRAEYHEGDTSLAVSADIPVAVLSGARVSVSQGPLLMAPSTVFPYAVFGIDLANANDADPAVNMVISGDTGVLLRSPQGSCSPNAQGVVTCTIPPPGQVTCDASGHSCTVASLAPGASASLALTLASGQCATVSIPSGVAEAGHDSIHVCAN
jgi:alpha-tubulin suppressor-like RCC1 family protein